MVSPARPSRTTANLKIPVLGDDAPADWVGGWGATADAVDAIFTAAAGNVSAQIADALGKLASGNTPNPAVEVRVIGGRLAQLVETRTDGTRNTSTLTWAGDVVTKVVQDNPARTFTFTYSGTTLTGWSVA